MKKFASLLLVFLLFCSCILPVSADVLWEPYSNDYYMNRSYDSFTGVARIYYVPEGMTVNFYESPEGGSQLTTLESGARVYVGFSRSVNGEVWGVGYPIGDWKTEGWFRLGRLQLEYDHEQFMLDHGDKVSAETVSMDVADLTGSIPTWTYPGSGVPDSLLDLEWEKVSYNDGKLDCSRVYTDPDGGKWGYVGYYMGRCGWIYLDDLYTETPPSFPQTAENTVTDTSSTEDAPSGSYTWIFILVGTVVVATAVCIVVLKRRTRTP